MNSEISILISECSDFLASEGYSKYYINALAKTWNKLDEWMQAHSVITFNEETGEQFVRLFIGDFSDRKNWNYSQKLAYRSLRILVSYQKTGSIEFRYPTLNSKDMLIGVVGTYATDYLRNLFETRMLSEKTLESKKLYMCKFCEYLNLTKINLEDVTTSVLIDFFDEQNYSLASRKVASACLREFLTYCFKKEFTANDLSVFVEPVNYKKNKEIPTTYTPQEIEILISKVNRRSPIGKRDYVILLLASEYGWRASDITNFQFSHIDWDENTISFSQNKTGTPVNFPLLKSVGNALIDYLKNGRPETDSPFIIVSHKSQNLGQKLSSPTIHSVVSKYMKAANIDNWKNKKHGPHALRHSLATNLLSNNESLPLISTVLGHQSTETTKIYLKIDTDMLKQCCQKMPKLSSEYYSGGEHND